MVATKILATVQKGSTPSSKQRRSASFDHTSSNSTAVPPLSASASVDIPPSSSSSSSSASRPKATSIDPSSQQQGEARTGAVESSGADASESSYGDYLNVAKSYAADVYERYAPSALTTTSTATPSAQGETRAGRIVVGEDEGDATPFSSLQQGVSSLLSSLYIRSYTNLNDLTGGDAGAMEDADHGQLILSPAEASSVGTNGSNTIRRGPPIELSWLTRNPYNVVSGRHNMAHNYAPSSMDAVRSLLTLVPSQGGDEQDDLFGSKRVRFQSIQQPKLESIPSADKDDSGDQSEGRDQEQDIPLSGSMMSVDSSGDAAAPHFPSLRQSSGGSRRPVSDAETASRLAEGTIRALRDLALDEAVELHSALRFWTERWERPVLSWLEAGPTVWFSRDGYNHQVVGKKVSQIQAVLARRCTSVGELQEHLLRAGWQRGVQQWGVLGQGGQWAAVAGGDGMMDGGASQRSISDAERADSTLSRESSAGAPRDGSMRDYYSIKTRMDDETSTRFISPQGRRRSTYYGQAEVLVRNSRGGGIERDDPALAAWTVDALRVIRDQLYKAGNRGFQLPYFENWNGEVEYFSRISNASAGHGEVDPATTPIRFSSIESLPLWATEDISTATYHSPDRSENRRAKFHGTGSGERGESTLDEEMPPSIDEGDDRDYQDGGMEKEVQRFIKDVGGGVAGDVTISDLPLFALEIAALLDSMEVLIQNQRRRRLLKLKPPPRIKRQWYVASIVAPSVGYIALKLFRDGYIKDGLRWAAEQLGNFYNEHLAGPIRSIYGELVKGKPDITDKKARIEAINTLKNMLGSWLDETYPKMSEDEKISIADAMDISLVEQAKEECIKRSLYEINNVVRLSMIEMQFIKKELMSALVAMDELMSSNEINAKIAAMTPVVILLYGARSIFRFCFYALLKFGKSKEETYQSFRHTILDIERLLTMRDNPPDAPPPLSGPLPSVSPRRAINNAQAPSQSNKGNVLDANDLGMLMLHIHECRMLLWEDRKRFSQSEARNVTEDLAELSGERGPVSVQQQLAIISRMCRTYSFLKVISTGQSFDFAFRSSL